MANEAGANEAGASDAGVKDGPGRKALRHIDQALAEKPKKNDHALSAATLCLTEFRDQMIGQRREYGAASHSDERLEEVNAVISVVMGLHFPLGDPPWQELEKARGWLVKLLA